MPVVVVLSFRLMLLLSIALFVFLSVPFCFYVYCFFPDPHEHLFDCVAQKIACLVEQSQANVVWKELQSILLSQ